MRREQLQKEDRQTDRETDGQTDRQRWRTGRQVKESESRMSLYFCAECVSEKRDRTKDWTRPSQPPEGEQRGEFRRM